MFQQNNDAQLLASIAAAGDGNDYADRYQPGEFVVALNTFELKDTNDHGKIVSMDVIILESNRPELKGKAAGEGFFIQKPDTQGGKGARQRAFAVAKAVVQSLGGNPDDNEPVMNPQTGQPVWLAQNVVLTKGHALVQQTLNEMTQPGQPWRGVVLRASASTSKGKNTGKEYVKVKYSPVPQTAEQIAACRKMIEAAATAPAPVAQPAAFTPAPQMTAAPAQPAAAPSMLAGYAPAQPAPQGAAPGIPGYAPVQQTQPAPQGAAPGLSLLGGTSLLG